VPTQSPTQMIVEAATKGKSKVTTMIVEAATKSKSKRSSSAGTSSLSITDEIIRSSGQAKGTTNILLHNLNKKKKNVEQGFTTAYDLVDKEDIAQTARETDEATTEKLRKEIHDELKSSLEKKGRPDLDKDKIKGIVQEGAEKIKSKIEQGKWYVLSLRDAYISYVKTASKYAKKANKLAEEANALVDLMKQAAEEGDVDRFNKLYQQYLEKKKKYDELVKEYNKWKDVAEKIKQDFDIESEEYKEEVEYGNKVLEAYGKNMDERVQELLKSELPKAVEDADITFGEKLMYKASETLDKGEKVMRDYIGGNALGDLYITAARSAADTITGGVGLALGAIEAGVDRDVGRLTILGGTLVAGLGEVAKEHIEALEDTSKLPTVLAKDVGFIAGGEVLGALGRATGKTLGKGYSILDTRVLEPLRPKYVEGKLALNVEMVGVAKGGKPFNLGLKKIEEFKAPSLGEAPKTKFSVLLDTKLKPGGLKKTSEGVLEPKLPSLEITKSVIDSFGIKTETTTNVDIVPKLPKWIKEPSTLGNEAARNFAKTQAFDSPTQMLDWVDSFNKALEKGETSSGKVYGIGEFTYKLVQGGRKYTTGEILSLEGKERSYIPTRISVYLSYEQQPRKGSWVTGALNRLEWKLRKALAKFGETEPKVETTVGSVIKDNVVMDALKKIDEIKVKLEETPAKGKGGKPSRGGAPRGSSRVRASTSEAQIQVQLEPQINETKATIPDLTTVVKDVLKNEVESNLRKGGKAPSGGKVGSTSILRGMGKILTGTISIGGLGLSNAPKLKQTNSTKIKQLQKTKIKQEELPIPDIVQIQDIEPIEIVTPTNTTTTITSTPPPPPPPAPPEITITPPPPPIPPLKGGGKGFRLIGGGSNAQKGSSKGKKGRKKQKAKYTPSLSAVVLDIRAKDVKFDVTGLGLRPIVEKKRGGRKK